MKRRYEDVREGEDLPAFVVQNLTRTDLVRYAGASGDFNPIHHDEEFARMAGNPSVFGHGMLTAGFVGKCVSDFVGVENLRRFKVCFTCKGRVTKRYEHDGEKRIDGEVVALNQKGEVAVSGSFSAALPTRG